MDDTEWREIANALMWTNEEAADVLHEAADTVDRLREELETERLRLAACGVAAMGNTESTVAQRIDRTNPYWSASYGDVCAAVDREMKLRKELAERNEYGYSQQTVDALQARIATLEALVLDVMAIRGDQYADWCDRATAALEEEP